MRLATSETFTFCSILALPLLVFVAQKLIKKGKANSAKHLWEIQVKFS